MAGGALVQVVRGHGGFLSGFGEFLSGGLLHFALHGHAIGHEFFKCFGALLLGFGESAQACEPNLLRLLFDVVGHVGRVKRVFGGHGKTFKVGVARYCSNLSFLRRLQVLAIGWALWPAL